MQKLSVINGKTVKEWAQANLPHGAFERMVRQIDPVYGIYAPAGAVRKRYVVEFQEGWKTEEIFAFHDEHARRMARHDFEGATAVRTAEGRRFGLMGRIIVEGQP